MRLNVPSVPIVTHEGGVAKRVNPALELRRSVMACMLWEDTFYEAGETIAERIAHTIPLVAPEKVAEIAIEAREKMKLRHVPLLVVREMARLATHKAWVADTLERVIQRPDELTEFLAIYWKDGRCPVSAQVKKGLSRAFPKFTGFSLAKYNRPDAIKLRDVLFISHAKPKDAEQAEVWTKLIDGTLESPDTWEVALSAGQDKKATWERLLGEKRLGALALLRNLRNFQEVGVADDLILNAIATMDVERVLPFRFIAAARYAPMWEPQLEAAMFRCLGEQEKLPGTTVLLVDVSGSMKDRLSQKSDMTRMDAACGVGMLLREICESGRIFTFSDSLVEVPTRRGFALRDAIVGSQQHRGTYLGSALTCFNTYKFSEPPARLIVITDEQAHDAIPDPQGKGYMINVACYQNGVGYGAWTHIDGWSEAVVDYIREFEVDYIQEYEKID